MKRIAIFLTGVLFAGAVQSADLGSYKDSPVAGGGDISKPFAGFYFGGNIGWSFANLDQSLVLDGEECSYCSGLREFAKDVNGYAAETDIGDENDGFSFGAQTGYNWQIGRVYGGPRVTFDYLDLDAGHTVSETDGDSTTTGKLGATVNWLATVGGKLGVAITENVGLYGHVGWAHADVDTRGSYSVNGEVLGSFKGSDSTNGIAYGAGVDLVLDHWQIFFEYARVQLDKVGSSGNVTGEDVDCLTYSHGVDPSLDIFKVGVNYRF